MPPASKQVIRLAIFLFAFFLPLATTSADERILAFHSELRIERNGDLVVTETITVRSEGEKIRRGIYRDFPRSIKLKNSQVIRVGFEVISIKRNGATEGWHQTRVGDFSRIYIGTRDRIIASGNHTYELTYRTNRQLRFFEMHDELFWNVTGTRWEFPIDHASALITLPNQIKAFETIFFTGPSGSRQKFAKSELLENGRRISFETTRPLDRHENLTIGIKMPKNSFPEADNTYFGLLESYKGETILGGGLLALIVFYLTIWWLVGRDQPKGIVVPRWDVSEAVSPALVYYVQHKGVIKNSVRAMSAALINLAVKRLIHIDNQSNTPIISRTKLEYDGALPIGEKAILRQIEQVPDQSIRLSIDTRRTQSVMLQHFVSALEHEHRKIYFLKNSKLVLGGIVFSVICMIAALSSGGVRDATFAIMVPAAAYGVFTTLMIARIIRDVSSSRSLLSRIIGIVLGVIIIVPFLAAIIYFLFSPTAELEQPIFIVLVIGTLTIHALFYYLMGAPTPLGRETMDYIAGLKTYLSLAEQDRLNLQNVPDFTPAHFEQLLPYAIALDLEKPWTRLFGTWLNHAMARNEIDHTYQPDWIELSLDADADGMSGAIAGFYENLEQSIAASTSLAHLSDDGSSAFDSHDSGFSGGGSSGDGGGGGSGGGW